MAYTYYNLNPLGSDVENDCVCRAISFALNQNYYEIEDLLYKNSQKCDCEALTKSCYRNLLEKHFGLFARRGYGRTVQQIANTFPNNRVIMRLNGHLTASDFGGIVKDIFDCSNEIVDEFWVVK